MGGILPPPPTPLITTTTSSFSLNNSKMVNPVTLEFCNIQQHSIRDIRSTFGVHNSHQSPDIGQNSDERIFNFQISVQSLIKENCHNSRTSDAIDMKLGPVTKLDKGNKTTSKIKNWWWHHVGKLWRHCYFSDFWPIWSSPEARFRTQSLQKLCFQ